MAITVDLEKDPLLIRTSTPSSPDPRIGNLRRATLRRLSSLNDQSFLHSTLSSVCSQLSQRSRSIRHQHPEGASWFTSALIMTNVLLGIGLLNFPRAYVDAGGILYALPMQMLCILLIFMGMMFLAHCAEKTDCNTLQEMVNYYWGPAGLLISNFFIVIHNFGTCIIFLIIMADQMDQIMRAIFGDGACHYWYLERQFTLPVVSIILILPLCFSKTIDGFSAISYLGVLTVFYLIFFVIWEYFHLSSTFQVYDLINPRANWVDTFRVAPNILVSYEVHIEAVPVFKALKKKTVPEFTKATILCLILATCVYTSVGVMGVLTFGSHVKSDMLTNYNPSDVFVIIAVSMQFIKAITTYPVILYCARLVVDDVIVAIAKERLSEPCRRFGATIVMFAASLSVAVFIPTMGSVINILGLSGVVFVFALPGLCFFAEYARWGRKLDTARCLMAFSLLTVGAFIAGVSLVQTIQSTSSGDFSMPEVHCS